MKILSKNKILTSIKGYNSVINLQKLMSNSPNLHLANINAYAKFGENPLIHTQDTCIEQEQNSDINQGP